MASLYHALKINYLSDEQLSGFDKYKYRCRDTSPLSVYVMHPFWNWILKYFPYWLAPNLMTFMGWILSVINFGILSYYDWDYTAASREANGALLFPPWVWFFCAISQFCLHTLDGCDGKQARRTSSSSPLGELFDHGLDSTEALLMPMAAVSMAGLGPTVSTAKIFLLVQLGVSLGFYFSHWEKYNTSVLFLPWLYDIGQLSLAGFYLITYFFGTKLWTISIIEGYTLGRLLPVMLGGSSVVGSLPVSIYNIYSTRQTNPEWTRPIKEGLMPLLPLSFALSFLLFWAFQSPMAIVDEEPRMFYITMGIVFSNITCRLIVCQMSSSNCERFNSLTYPLLVIVPLAMLNLINERVALYAYCAFVALAHLHYGICVVNQLCDHLHIRCFKVSTPRIANGTPSSKKVE